MSDIKLNFVNRSNDASNSRILIFQKNVSTDFDSLAVAWRVIQNCGIGSHHPFKFPLNFEVDARDSYGNYTPRLTASNGQSFEMARADSGNVLRQAGRAVSSKEVEVVNRLSQGSICARMYKDGNLLATKLCVAPEQKAVFQFKPTIWIGVASEVVQGEIINSAVLQNINTELNLLGIRSADIVMYGGGCGQGSQPFEFRLENVVLG